MVKIHLDLRLIEIEYELWALGEFLNYMEPQIAHLADQDRVQTFAKLREAGWEHDETEVQLAIQELSERHDYVIPRFMRGPFIVALWACYEAAVSEIAVYRKRQQGATLDLRELRGDNFLTRARRYFDAVLDSALELDEARYHRLADLLAVRNALAHANGQRRGMSFEAWDRLTEILRRHDTPPDEYRGIVVLSAEYVRHAFEDINASARDLVNRARGGPSRRIEPA